MRGGGANGIAASSSVRPSFPFSGARSLQTWSGACPLTPGVTMPATSVDLFSPYTMLGGLVVLSMFATHGAIFLTLKTSGGIRHDARELGTRLAVVTVILLVAFLGWTIASHGDARSATLAIAVVAATVGAAVANARGRDGVAFFLTAGAVVLLVTTYFSLLYPNVMPSTMDPANNLTIANASSSPYTLTLMSWVAVLVVPFVLAYQVWSYWVFRKRLSRDHIPLIPQHGAAAGGNRST